jgi:nucleoside-diphosphate-sugar epimerase
MVIGNGMLATAFKDYNTDENIVIFASGVSNSKANTNSEFDREYQLLKNTVDLYSDKILVYFSTVSMYDPDSCHSPYVKHKVKMEKYIHSASKQYYIFRISQIIGKANNGTLINFLLDSIINDKEFELWTGVTRNLIAIADVVKIVSYFIDQRIHLNQIINIANVANIQVLAIVKILEKILGKKALYHLKNKGLPMASIDIALISEYFNELNIDFNANYYSNSIVKLLNSPLN